MSTPRSIALVGSPRCKDVDSELPLLVHALAKAGASPTVVAWYDAAVDWAAFDLVVVKSPWDADAQPEAFDAWLERLERSGANALNPVAALRWNSDKRHLAEVLRAGVPVIPTAFVVPGDEPSFPDGEFVVKPAVSAGARNTARYAQGQHEAAREHVRTLHAQGLAVMVQPYARAIETAGERALVFYNGVFDHAIRKDPILKLGDPFDMEGREPHPNPVAHRPSADELQLAREALAATPHGARLLYARVDMTEAEDGTPIVMELELLNPNLFFAYSAGADERYAAAILDRVSSRPQ